MKCIILFLTLEGRFIKEPTNSNFLHLVFYFRAEQHPLESCIVKLQQEVNLL